MNVTIKTPIGEVVTTHPSTADLFDRLGIDYFCRGEELLGDALREHNVSLDAFAGALFGFEQKPSGPDWRFASLRLLIAEIVDTHHEYLRLELPALEELIVRIQAQPAGTKPVFLTPLHRLLDELGRDLELQMRKEEAILFPAIADLERIAGAAPFPRVSPFGSVANLSRVLGKEHEKTARSLRDICALTNHFAPVPDGPDRLPALFERLRAVIAGTHRHLHLENNILFPRAIELEKGRHTAP